MLLFVCFALKVQAQIGNYVTNPSFEVLKFAQVPTGNDGIYGWGPIDTTKRAYLLYTVGPPLYNAPNSSYGFQFPRTGNNMIGSSFFYSNGNPESNRWYPRNRIKQPLQANKIYCARYFVVNTNNSPVGIDAYSILLAGTEIDTIKKCNIPLAYLTPQVVHDGGILTDTMNWTPISGTFTANGTEKYLILGNFKADANTQSIVINPNQLPVLANDNYIDDVSLVEMELPAFAGRDTFMIPGDSIFLGREPDVGIDYACQWYKLPDSSVPIDTIAGFWAKPNETTTYVVRQQLWCSGVKWDTVTVTISGVGFEELAQPLQVRMYPNPANDKIEFETNGDDEILAVTILDVSGRKVLEKSVEIKEHRANLIMALNQGMYFIHIQSSSNEMLIKKMVIAK